MSGRSSAPPGVGDAAAAGVPAVVASRRRAYWLKTLHEWHWISSALCLIGMLLFSLTGITLNHGSQIDADPQVTSRSADLPPALRAALAPQPGTAAKANAVLPDDLKRWVADTFGVEAGAREAEWTADEIYLALPRPGGDAWLRIERGSGAVEYELTDRGWISYLNDLHKGRNTGAAWSWFIDIFAAATLVFAVTGLFILKMHAARRAATWPIVALGLVIPMLLALLTIH